MSRQPIRVPKASELVAAELRRQILNGEVAEGAYLPAEPELMRQLDVSRPTMREALRILESESLIEVRRGAQGGARVRVPDGDLAGRYAGYVLGYRKTTMADVHTARAEIEAPLARLLTERAQADQLDRLRAAIDAAAPHVGDPRRYVEHDVAFHRLVAELAGNQTLAVMVEMLYHIITTARLRYVALTGRESDLLKQYRQVHRTHARFVDLVAAGDSAAAEDWWRAHLAEVNKHYLVKPMAETVVEMMS